MQYMMLHFKIGPIYYFSDLILTRTLQKHCFSFVFLCFFSCFCNLTGRLLCGNFEFTLTKEWSWRNNGQSIFQKLKYSKIWYKLLSSICSTRMILFWLLQLKWEFVSMKPISFLFLLQIHSFLPQDRRKFLLFWHIVLSNIRLFFSHLAIEY